MDTLYDTLGAELFGPDGFEGDLLVESIRPFVVGLVQTRWESQAKSWARLKDVIEDSDAALLKELDSKSVQCIVISLLTLLQPFLTSCPTSASSSSSGKSRRFLPARAGSAARR